MAKVKSPALSLDATGSIGKSLTFSHWKGESKAMKHFKPRNPRSRYQTGQRSYMQWAVMGWQSMSVGDKEDYNQTVKNLNLKMSGYNYFLSEYISNMVYELNPIQDGLVGWYRMDEGEKDFIRNSINAGVGTLGNCEWIDGTIGIMIKSNGTTSWIDINNDTTLDIDGPFSFDFWFTPYNTQIGTGNILTHNEWAPNKGFRLAWNDQDKIKLWFGSRTIITSNALNLDQTYHIVITYDGTDVKLYIDDSYSKEEEDLIGPVSSNQSYTFFSNPQHDSDRAWIYIRDFKVYNRPLSLTEVQHNYYVFI